MKKTKLSILFFGALLLSSMLPLMAQKNLEQWQKKCESIESVEMTIINKKNPNTKELERKLIQISFKDNPALLKDLFAAIDKDRGDATRVIENKKGKMIVPNIFTFQKDSVETQYIFNIGEEKTEVVIVTRVREK